MVRIFLQQLLGLSWPLYFKGTPEGVWHCETWLHPRKLGIWLLALTAALICQLTLGKSLSFSHVCFIDCQVHRITSTLWTHGMILRFHYSIFRYFHTFKTFLFACIIIQFTVMKEAETWRWKDLKSNFSSVICWFCDLKSIPYFLWVSFPHW